MAGEISRLFVVISASTREFMNGMDEVQSKMKKVGDKLTGMGTGLSAGLTLPLAALGAAAFKTATDFQDSQTKIQAALGVTAEEAKELNGVAKDLWKNAFGGSVDEAAQGLIAVKQNMAELVGAGDVERLTEQAFILSDAFGADIGEATKTAATMMRTFGISGDEAFDIMTLGFQQGGDSAGELLGTLSEYSTHFQAAGVDAKDMLGMLLTGAEAGAFSIDKVGDAVKEMGIRMKDGSESTSEALTGLGLDAEKLTAAFAAGGPGAQEAFTTISTALASIKDPLVQTQLGVALFGTQWEDVGATVVTSMQNGIDSFGVIEGATQKAGAALYDNFGSRMTSLFRGAQDALAPLGAILLTMAEEWLPKVSLAMQTVSDWFGKLSPGMQESTVIIGLLVAAIGPLLIVAGMLVSAIAAISLPVVAVIAGVAALIAIGVLLWQNWETVKAKAVEIWEAIGAFLDTKLGKIVAIMSGPIGVGLLIIRNWDLIKQTAMNVWGSIVDFFNSKLGALVTLMSGPIGAGLLIINNWALIKEKSAQIWNAIAQAVRGPVNMLIGFANAVLGAFESMLNGVSEIINSIPSFSIPDWVPGIGGKSFSLPHMASFSLPRIPSLAIGTDMVNSEGLAMLHSGEAVVPADVASGGFSRGNGEVNLYIDGRKVSDIVGRHMVDKIRTKTGSAFG